MRIKERRFSQTADTIPSPLFSVVIRCTVPGRPVIPDGHIVLVPSEANLSVVVLGDELLLLALGSNYTLPTHTLNRYCSNMSDSSLVMPLMRRVKPRFTYTDFHPVTAGSCQHHSSGYKRRCLRLVRTTGCTAVSSSPEFNGEPRIPFRIGFPNLLASSWKNVASCVAVNVSRNAAICGDNRS